MGADCPPYTLNLTIGMSLNWTNMLVFRHESVHVIYQLHSGNSAPENLRGESDGQPIIITVGIMVSEVV